MSDEQPNNDYQAPTTEPIAAEAGATEAPEIKPDLTDAEVKAGEAQATFLEASAAHLEQLGHEQK